MTGKTDSIQETIALIKDDENNRAYFFSKAKDKKWFEPLKAAGFFDMTTIPRPVKTEKGFVLSFWPQQGYLERLAVQIQSKTITDAHFIESFAGALRNITSTAGNFILGRVLFLIVMKIPLPNLKSEDIERAFSWLLDGDTRDSLLETTVQEGLDLILSQAKDAPHERSLFKEFTRHFFTISKKEKHRGRDPKLVFFSDWSYKQFRDKHFNVEKLVADRPFILFDVIDVAEKALTDILSNSDLDKSTNWWRPAIEEHYQNNFHDSAQAIILGAIGMCVGALAKKGHTIPQAERWRTSEFKTFNRMYLFLAAKTTDENERARAAQKVLDLDFAYECLHEIYHFLASQFDSLSTESQGKILDSIEKMASTFSEEEELKKRQTAWMRLRWLEAISKSSNPRVQQMRAAALSVTNNGVPEHPDFGSYMGPTFVGPTSPKDLKWLSESSSEVILKELRTFKDTSDFASPSIDGFARILEAWVAAEPMKASALIKELDTLNPQYVSALLDGYSKCWNEKKYVPLADLIESIKKLITPPAFAENVAETDSRMCWAVTSISRFIEAGTRRDENAFDPDLNEACYLILKRCLEVSLADKRYEKSSDFYSRAINEPRGRVFEALVILTLRRARLAKDDTTAFAQAWSDLASLIDPILQRQDEHETSLHAHLGAFCLQFHFLSKDWFTRKFDLIVPPLAEKPTLWRAFMDGFSYVSNYSQEMYLQLKNKGHLLSYMRLDVDSDEKSSRLDRLQERVIELTLVAYVVGDELLDNEILAAILTGKNAEEWRQLIWSVQSVIGEDPKPEHLAKAKELVSKLIEIKDADAPGENFKEHFSGLGRFLELIKDPTDEMVAKIIKIVAEDRDSPWELGDIIDYLHQFKDSHAKVVGDLFKLLLAESNAAPAYPDEKVRELSQSLLQHGEKNTMIDVCRIYSERSPTCEPIRDICAGIGKH